MTSPTGGSSGALHGVLLLTGTMTTAMTVEAVDPSNGQVTGTRTFSFPPGAAPPGGGQQYPAYVARGFFNSDLSLVAAEGPVQPDGSTEAGVVDTHGHFTALTTPSSGYSSPARRVALGFGPDGRLWYATNVAGSYTGFGSVDPAKGPASQRSETVSAATLHTSLGSFSGAAFWAGNYGPIDAHVGSQADEIFLPRGTEADETSLSTTRCPNGDSGWRIGPDGSVTDSTAARPDQGECPDDQPTPVWPIDANHFLSTSSGGAVTGATQIYDNTIATAQVTLTPLLPQSDRAVQSVLADPTGTTAAFISQAGGVTTLYTVPVQAGQQPRPVKTLDSQVGYALLGWVS